MSNLQELPNIGKEMERQLNAIGISTYDDLVNCGSREAWLKIKAIDSSACINRLMGLEGAIQGIRWHNLSEVDKQSLKDFYYKNKERDDTNV